MCPHPVKIWCPGVDHGKVAPMISDDEWTIERHLAGKPDFAVDLYDKFIEMVEVVGPFRYAVNKSSITLKGTRRGFAGARPMSTGLRGYFDLQREVADPRITSSGWFSKTLIVHHFKIDSVEQLDEEFAGWVREAYAVDAGVHLC